MRLETLDEDGVRRAARADGGRETDDPEAAEIALLLAAIAERVLTGLDDGLTGLAVRLAAHALVPLGELADLLVTTMPVDSALNTHGLEVRDEGSHPALIGRVDEERAVQALLTLVLLHKEVAAAIALDGQLAGSGASEPLLRAAVGLLLRHGARSVRAKTSECNTDFPGRQLRALGRTTAMNWLP